MDGVSSVHRILRRGNPSDLPRMSKILSICSLVRGILYRIGTNLSATRGRAYNCPTINKLQRFGDPPGFVAQIGFRCAQRSRAAFL
jgi:hypothetical protein